jgi:DNA-binding transcriptional ArsR family regulator
VLSRASSQLSQRNQTWRCQSHSPILSPAAERHAEVRILPPDGEDALDQVFAALADPVRRSILSRLDGQELLVSQIAQHFDISLQAVSKHIHVLVRAGLVAQERTGRISRCSLTAGPIFDAAVWLNRYSKYWRLAGRHPREHRSDDDHRTKWRHPQTHTAAVSSYDCAFG